MKNKNIIVGLTILFLVFQLVIFIIEKYHDCTHDTTCTVCNLVLQIENQSKLILTPASNITILFFIFTSLALKVLFNILKNTNPTLIDLKVRINN